ncbi:Hypothetical protein, putative [Bodo saltans]|uniref:Serine racemase n=1 Tax=Bodo saltans TaxID=75058 RepID=A0A0S4IP22_BODSA|nr:Hypothetical protein, putative [Bodo saltans]|eukprot:CUE97162.1 Hypothetical protein, putative [Bodo saltans]
MSTTEKPATTSTEQTQTEVPAAATSGDEGAKAGPTEVAWDALQHLHAHDPWVNVQLAKARLARYMHPTMCSRGRPVPGTQLEVWYKCDHLRQTGSYKERGALNALLQLTPEEAQRGVIAASAGNHAQALARWGKAVGVPVTVVMPHVAPITKVENCKFLGAEVVLAGRNFGEAKADAEKRCRERGMVYINGYDHPAVIAGAGTCGLEILDQLPDVDAIIVPVGGGGLIAGIALAVKRLNPRVKVIGVESERCPSMCNALRAGKPVFTNVGAGGTIADGLSVSVVGANAFKLVREFVDEVITTTEASISLAILHLLETEKLLVEGAGCAGLAAIMSGRFDHSLRGKKVCTILCGGNIDMTVLGRVIEKGLYSSGRMLQFDCAISDRVGGLAHFMNCLALTGASVKNIMQEHPFISDMGVVAVHLTVETMNAAHARQVVKQMDEQGFKLKLADDKKYSDVNLSRL